jgi:hypothetical protein
VAKPAKKKRAAVPGEVAAISKAIRAFFDQKDPQGRIVGDSQYGVYAFYDYDGEPIYVGRTREKLRSRIGRHLTNQRTDAVAMNVLDPFEVASIEVWPIYQQDYGSRNLKNILNQVEYAVFQLVLKQSDIGAVLNEKDIAKQPEIALPVSYKGRIIPDGLYESRKHPDVRIARRAGTIANLARVISERHVSKGLRRTLLTQAKRLELLAGQRLAEIGGDIPVKSAQEEE